ncbi:MAG: histidine phosphatase family protein, partial [Bacillota bacterium]
LKEIKQKYPELYQTWLEHPEKAVFPGGENLKKAADRAEEGIYRAAGNNPGGHTIIFAHRAINKVLLCRLLGLGEPGFWKIRQDTACLNELAYGSRNFILVKLNDTCHLQDIDATFGQTKS